MLLILTFVTGEISVDYVIALLEAKFLGKVSGCGELCGSDGGLRRVGVLKK